MSSADDGSCAIKNVNTVYNSLVNFISSVEKGTSSDVALRLRQVENSIEQLRESIDSISDISSNEEIQREKIRSLKKQIAAKDSLIASFKNGTASPMSKQKKNIKEVEKETLSEWWSVKKAYDFENIGFTHDASDGIKYLVCADCEVGPVGFLCPETNCHFIACKRVKSMQDGS
ncbi:unnamed protein product [Anisakis simplex]|uniref:Mediator of RNA polymerase II transcription subunit 9 n=1 Tax=Anisakis simplex TaxID=6269 RepID=A0A0M3K2W6_ANISI|nr:unnamed protein product [Anisakis simplex]